MTKREAIRIYSGKPVIVTLETAIGRQCKSNYTDDGVQYAYDVTEQGAPKVLFLPTEGRDALARSGASDGEDVRLLKTGQNGHTQWQAAVVSDAHLEVPAPPPAPQRQIRVLAGGSAAPAKAEPVAQAHPMEDLLTRCFECAARATWRAFQTVSAEGVELDAPIWEDVRAAGISLFIERTRNGGLR